jgi:diadenosine tetraphosphatase ApaH/serine/threonine PP2A family protein phosphatase
MKVAILADIHGNLEALQAVQADLLSYAVDRVVCLGDNIGYGPDPDGVITLIRQQGYASMLGNHEFALTDKRGRRWLNFQAAENNQETKELLSPENLQFCRSLPLFIQLDDGHFVHGFPEDSIFRYLPKQDDEKIKKLFEKSTASVFFVGHTHDLQLVTEENGIVLRRGLQQGRFSLDPTQKYIINCGSVGQPRDGDKRAKYVLWDSVAREIEVRFVGYDVEQTKDKIHQRGFPKVYALRLS